MEPGATVQDWHAHRLANGVGESGDDFPLGDAFPHDVLMDQNGGVSFRKGCFVGQEVVSRMQHRGTARRRLLIAEGATALPEPGMDIVAGERTIGTLGSVSGSRGLALVRIDRAAKAISNGDTISAGGTAIVLSIPDWASFDFPAADTETIN